MVRQWGDLPYRERTSILHWVKTNPLFALAIVIFVSVAVTILYIVIRDFTGTQKFVVIETYDVGMTAAAGHAEISIQRVSYQPSFDIRLGGLVRQQSSSQIIIDGYVTNHSERHLIAMFPIEDQHIGAIIFGPDAQITKASVRALGIRSCPALLMNVMVVEPGDDRRVSIQLLTERGADTAWVRKSVKDGVLPRLSIGPFALGDCESGPSSTWLSEAFRIEFGTSDLMEPELRDYYPFGAPTNQSIGVNGRRYWTDWLPRRD